MKTILINVICLAWCVLQTSSENTKLKDIFSWKVVDYAWMKPEDRATAVEKGEFIPKNNLPLGLEVWKDKLFITVPRWRSGVVSTLNYVKLNEKSGLAVKPEKRCKRKRNKKVKKGRHGCRGRKDHCKHDLDDEAPAPPTETTPETDPSPATSPALIPYPSFQTNCIDTEKEGETITSVFRVRADACDRLWVMDTGVADILGDTKVISKPRILIYNLNDDTLIRSYELKDTDSTQNSFYANIIVDVDGSNCDKAFAYVPDLGGYGIVVYDFANNDSWRVKHNYFHFDPLKGNMTVGGVNFQWTDGVFSVALSKPKEDGYRTAFFHALASTKEFKVDTRTLQTKEADKRSYHDFHLIGDRGDESQSSASFIQEDSGVMFYTQLQKDGVYCWNTNKDLVPENLVEIASDNDTMIFTNDLKVDTQGRLWVLTDRLPTFIYRGLGEDETNYHIFSGKVDEIIAGTNCAA